MSIKGIDISEHQGASFKVGGYGFVMIRASWGHFTEDRQVRNNVENCLASGVPYGLYHYSYARNDAEARQEATQFLRLSRQFGGRSYPLCLDMEDADGWKAENGVSMAQEIRTIKIFKEVIEGAGEYLLLYVNRDWWNRLRAIDASVVDSLDLWLAHWGISEPSVPCGMWQYHGSPLDKDIAYKDYPSIIKGTKPSPTPTPEPKKSVDEVAKEIINKPNYGGWGVDPVRTQKLTAYNGATFAAAVQARVNELANVKPIVSFKKGDKVKVYNAINYDTGASFAVYYPVYDVIQAKDNRIVIGIGSNVTAAIHKDNLRKA